MRTGIYLGPQIGRARRLTWLLVFVGSLATAFHLASYVSERDELATLRESVERRESAGGRVPDDVLGDDGRAVLARLRAASASGVAASISPTEILQLMGVALPDRVALVSLDFQPASTPPSLTVEAIAGHADDVTALQKQVADSQRVSATQLLGERTARDGTLAVRLQVDLVPER